jgi:opacity protein-like surface antigen
MKNRNCFSILVAVIVFTAVFAVPAVGQIDFKVGGGIGLVMPAADYGGSTIDYYNGSKYGLGTGYNLHVKARLGLVGFRLAGEVDYSSLKNDGFSEPGQGKVEISQQVLSIKIGPEMHLSIPMMPITPYLGANVALHRFSGETIFQGVSQVSSASYALESATRLGIGVSGGVLFSLAPFTTLDVSIGYNLMNLSGSEWKDLNPTQDQRIDTYLALNDEQDPAYQAGNARHVVSAARDIHSIQIGVTVLFGL